MKQLIGLETTDTPNDAFSRITLGNKRYGINLYVKFQNGEPVSGVTITSSGSPPISGSMVTDSNGYLFLAQDDTSFAASIDNANGKVYIDCVESPSVSTTLSKTITTVNLTWNFKEDIITIDTSKTVTFSASAKTFDVCAVGGGGGGGAGHRTSGGGGGGYTNNLVKYSVQPSKQMEVVVGFGGTGGSYDAPPYSTDGGTTTVKYNGTTICSARGGSAGNAGDVSASGGSGSGKGGTGRTNNDSGDWHGDPGGNSTVYIFNESSLGLAGGGGGGGGSAYTTVGDLPSQYTAPGGQPYGATGGCSVARTDQNNVSHAGSASGPGGGGGGGAGNRGQSVDGGNGHEGVVYLRFHH